MHSGSDATLLLFDAAWYRQAYPDVAASGLDALVHWRAFGANEGRQPNLYFEPRWYLQHNPDVFTSGMDPLLHYVRFGEVEGRHPSAFFDPVWYRRIYKPPGENLAIAHFLTHRWTGRYAPSPALYAVCGPRSNATRQGALDEKDPFASMVAQVRASGNSFLADFLCISTTDLLDPNFYLIHGFDVLEADLDPINHFCLFGWREARKPNLYFDTTWYLAANPDVAELQVNPLSHYILHGEKQGRCPIPYFDPAWYRETYRLEPTQNALAHFLAYRRSQQFSPNPCFDVSWYMRRYGDRVGSNRDPFAHYLRFGTISDLDPSAEFNAKEYRKRYLGRISRAFPHLMRPQDYNPLVHHLRRTLARTREPVMACRLYDELASLLPLEGG